jgi:hypothetical protein
MFDCEYKINTFNGKKSYSNNGMTLPLVFFIVGILGLITGIVGVCFCYCHVIGM